MIYRIKVLRDFSSDDFEAVVEMHFKTFKGLFSSDLGKSYLRSFYKEIVFSPENVCYVCKRRTKVVGFICGTADAKKAVRLPFKIKFPAYFLAALVRDPKTMVVHLIRFAGKFLLFRDSNVLAELLSIAVVEEVKGRGVGRKLLDHFQHFLLSKDQKKFRVFTDMRYSTGSKFYEKLNFSCVKKANLLGLEVRYYEKVLEGEGFESFGHNTHTE